MVRWELEEAYLVSYKDLWFMACPVPWRIVSRPYDINSKLVPQVCAQQPIPML